MSSDADVKNRRFCSNANWPVGVRVQTHAYVVGLQIRGLCISVGGKIRK